MSESIFLIDSESPRASRLATDDGHAAMVVQPTEQARGPWDPRALHGGAPAALITSAFELMEPGAELRIGRLCFEFLRPIPFAPLKLSTSVIRTGKRVQELAAELTASDELICRASALRVQ